VFIRVSKKGNSYTFKLLIWFSFMPGVHQFDLILNSILHQICEFRITGLSPAEAAWFEEIVFRQD